MKLIKLLKVSAGYVHFPWLLSTYGCVLYYVALYSRKYDTIALICFGGTKASVIKQVSICSPSKVTTVIRGRATSLCPGPAWKGTTAPQERPRPSNTPAPEAPSTQESGHAALLSVCCALLDTSVLQWACQSPQVRCVISFQCIPLQNSSTFNITPCFTEHTSKGDQCLNMLKKNKQKNKAFMLQFLISNGAAVTRYCIWQDMLERSVFSASQKSPWL